MKLAIIGSRSIIDKDKVYEIIKEYAINTIKLCDCKHLPYQTICNKCEKPEIVDTIISGGAIGVDSIAKEYAKDNNLGYVEYFPFDECYMHLKSSDRPLARNTNIANSCDVLLCIHDGYSKGSLFAYDQAIRMGKKAIYIYMK